MHNFFAYRQDLCPALVQLLGSPLSDVGKRGKQLGTFNDDGRGIRGPGRNLAQAPIAKGVYSVAGELIRLVGPMASLRSTLESLFHRIILYPPPQHRLEALKVIKEVCMYYDKLNFSYVILHIFRAIVLVSFLNESCQYRLSNDRVCSVSQNCVNGHDT